MMISILILILCCCLAISWILTCISSEKTVKLMPVLLLTEGVASAVMLICSFPYRKVIVSVLLTTFFCCYLFYLVFHREVKYQPGKKLMVFSYGKGKKFSCELKEIYDRPEDFPQKKGLYAYRTPDQFIMLHYPDGNNKNDEFAYQFTNYRFMTDNIQQNCLVVGTMHSRSLKLFSRAEHLFYSVLMILLAVPILFISVIRQSADSLETFISYHAETGVTAVSSSRTEICPHKDYLTLVISKTGDSITSLKVIALNQIESDIEIITINPRLMCNNTSYTLLKDYLNTEDFGQIKTYFQDVFGIELNHILAFQNDRFLTDRNMSLSVTAEQLAQTDSGIVYQENGSYSMQSAFAIIQNLEQYLVSEQYDSRILSENELAVMQNELMAAMLSSIQQISDNSDTKFIRTTMTISEIRSLYDTIIIAESRYRNCFQQKEHSTVLPTADFCTELDAGTLYTADSVLRYLMIQALYY